MQSFSDVTKIVVNGTDGADTIVLGENADGESVDIDTVVFGKGDADIIVTGEGNDYVEGGGGDDTIFTYGGQDVVYGDVSGNTTITGNDTLVGGAGNDILLGGPGNDFLNENNDRSDATEGYSAAELAEENILDGGSGEDRIFGSPGRDTIVGGDGNDKITGLHNDDTYVFESNYGTDTFADYFGVAAFDFGPVSFAAYSNSSSTNLSDLISALDYNGVTTTLNISISDDEFSANAAGGSFVVERFIEIPLAQKTVKTVISPVVLNNEGVIIYAGEVETEIIFPYADF